MRKITGSDTVIDRMLSGDNEIIFNLISLIRSDENAMIYTDDKSYLTAQSNPCTPIWVYINESIDSIAEDEVSDILVKAIEKNENVHIIGFAELLKNVLDRVSTKNNAVFFEYMPMNVYTCYELKTVEGKGDAVIPKAQNKPRIVTLMKQMAKDAEDYDMTDEEAETIADAFEGSMDVLLWQDTDIVALARIAHRDQKYARINTVVTDRAYRGKGYAKMLVGEISRNVLEEGLKPVLYADARNPFSNSVYQNIGYEKIGEVMEYSVTFKV